MTASLDGGMVNGGAYCDTSASTDPLCRGAMPPGCVGEDCACGEDGLPLPTFGDPVNATSGDSILWRDDVVLPDAAGEMKMSRIYNSSAATWDYGMLTGVPKPFGQGPSNPDSPNWWHSLYSLVHVTSTRWAVREGNGHILWFQPCQGTTCWAAPDAKNRGIQDKLQRTTSGFTLWKHDGERMLFEATWAPPGGTVNRYFLSSIHSRTGLKVLELAYTYPTGLGCPANGSTGTLAPPYLSIVTGANGTKLKLDYAALPRIADNTSKDCVVRSVSLWDPSSNAYSSLVSYSYAQVDGVEYSGLLAKVQRFGGASEWYKYPAGAMDVSMADIPVMTHEYDSSGSVSTVRGRGELLSVGAPTAVPCAPGSDCGGKMAVRRSVTDSNAGRGDGLATDGGAYFVRRYDTLNNVGQWLEPRLYQVTDDCGGAAWCSPGSVRYEWSGTADGGVASLAAVKDKRDVWEVHQTGYATDGAGAQRQELRWVGRGAFAPDGGGVLESTSYSYAYDPSGVQQLRTQETVSVLGPQGEAARTFYRYDSTTGRKTAEIKAGWTRVFDAATGAWTEKQQYLATFFYDHHACLGGAPDTLGRTLEVHGPCAVTDENATTCSAGDYPVTRYVYWGATEGGYLANKLKSVTTFPGGAADCGNLESGLTTEYAAYDVRGRPTQVVDANGAVTQLVYDGEYLTSSVVGKTSLSPGLTTGFGYDAAGQLSWVRQPAGDYEVFCYRSGTVTGCSEAEGVLTDKLQWKAKSATWDGATWAEKVTYTYWPDGSLKEERYLDASDSSDGAGAVRRVASYAADAHRRPTFHKWGEGSGSFSATKSYDGADNITGVGHAFNAPPAWCGGVNNVMDGAPLSSLCAKLKYDRANRLAQVDEYPTASMGQRSLFDYDAHGNVRGVKTGCNTADTYASCVQPEANYLYDDFGRLVEASLPQMDGAVKSAYDAQGNVQVRQTPAMRAGTAAYLLYSHDALGRLLSLEKRLVGSSPAPELLYAFQYDRTAQPPANCPAIDTSNTMGRLERQVDSLGSSWITYNSQGQVTAIYRQRVGAADCQAGKPEFVPTAEAANSDQAPNSFYQYDNTGRLTAERLPHGRLLQYQYAASAARERVVAITYGVWSSSRNQAENRGLITNVRYEPYGGLRAYEINKLGFEGIVSVELLLGDNGSVFPLDPKARPSLATNDGTGRVRALWVSKAALIGSPTGDVFRQTYTWRADQRIRESTSLLNGPLRTVCFASDCDSSTSGGYDGTLRLTEVRRPAGQHGALGGSVGRRTYSYDGRGNRTEETRECASFSYASADPAGTKVDRLGSQTLTTNSCQPSNMCSAGTASRFTQSFTYDADGRVATKLSGSLPSGQPAWQLSLSTDIDGEHAAVGAVYKSATVNGAVYEYFYDANGRRRLKVYPDGTTDEYFHAGENLLADRGNGTGAAAGNFVVDEYVWLEGRPVAVFKSRFSGNYNADEESRLTGSCSRLGEEAACGVYFPVTDPLGKPVLLLDPSGKVAGAADYDPSGHANRVTLVAESEHNYQPYANKVLAHLKQPPEGSTSVRLKAHFQLIDTESCGSTPCDYAYLSNMAGTQLGGSIGGTSLRSGWTDWVQVPSDGVVHVRFKADGSDCSGVSKSGTCVSGGLYSGVVMDSYEYQRYETGATPTWLPLRFPGHYHDAETDLFENWNRYYDPSIGRYLQPEPMLQESRFVVGMARQGYGAPAYAYALNNPLAFTDPTGLDVFLCERVADLPFNQYLGVKHHWIRTDRVEAGMGPANGGVPGVANGGGKAAVDSPYVTQTTINDHTGQYLMPGARCYPIRDIDEACVDRELSLGRSTGRWSLVNQCQTMAAGVLSRCRKWRPPNPNDPRFYVGPIYHGR